MKLTLKYIESFNFKKKTIRPDWDDAGYEFTLPNGLVLTGFFMLNNEPCETESLEGVDGYIYIETEEELVKLVNQSIDEIFIDLKFKNPKFNIDEYL